MSSTTTHDTLHISIQSVQEGEFWNVVSTLSSVSRSFSIALVSLSCSRSIHYVHVLQSPKVPPSVRRHPVRDFRRTSFVFN